MKTPKIPKVSSLLNLAKLALKQLKLKVHATLEFVAQHPIRAFIKTIVFGFRLGFRVSLIFILLCYLLAFFFPRPLDHLVRGAHYFFFGNTQQPDLKRFIKFEEPAIGEIHDAQGKVVIKLAKEYRRINQYSDFPSIVVGAVLSAEDRRFFEHDGVDYWVLFTSVPWDVIKDTIAEANKHRPYVIIRPVFSRGGSTLTQQAVRLHLLSDITKVEKGDKLIADNWRTKILTGLPFTEVGHINTILRKIRELHYAIYTEKEFRRLYGSKRRAKEEEFARYASSVYLGSVYGLGYGGEFYFGKNIKSFTKEDAEKAALLAGMIKYPLPRIHSINRVIPEKYLIRKNEILRLMAVNQYINHQEAGKFMEKKIEFSPLDKEKTTAPSVVNDIRRELASYGFSSDDLFKGFINVTSTVDLKIQEIANQALETGLIEYEKRHPENKGKVQGSVVVLRNKDAAVFAAIGGRKVYQGRVYQYSDLNRINRARQAGSAFKPFVYLTAFMNGWKPNDIISDSPVAISMGYGRGSHWIHNYDGKYLGNITMCEALYRSRNAPTVRLTMSLGQGSFDESGMKKIVDTARLLGVKSPFHSDIDHLGRTVYYPTSALGASEITVIELANAYREIASGISVEPYIVQRVINRSGKVIFEKKENRQISEISPEALNMIRSCLRKVVTQPGGTAYSLTLENFPVPIAGKTGTTDDFRNALFAGWTHGPEGITIVARIDFDDNRELGSGETGARTVLPVVKEIFRKIYEQNLVGPASQFPEYTEKGVFDDLVDIQQ